MSVHGLDASKTSEWLTPAFFFPALRLTFDLDPAHPGRNNLYCTVPTRRIYTVTDDGLRQPWSGLTWLNPPFGDRRGKVPWLRKFFAHGNGIALVAAYTSCDWFHNLVVPHAQTLVFPRGKTKFLRASDGSLGKEPSTGSVLIGMGSVANAALRRCELGLFVHIREPTPIAQKILEVAPTAPTQLDFFEATT
jgi:hypothetical protein